jgi:hypothetical protein
MAQPAMTRRLLPLLLLCVFALAPAYAQANCSGPAGIAGTIIFNTTFNVMQYCDGTNWINMGGVASNTAAAGSTSAVQFNTSNALDADSSYFIWDKTNHRLGIGSTTPGSALDVKGTIRLSGATSGYVGLSQPRRRARPPTRCRVRMGAAGRCSAPTAQARSPGRRKAVVYLPH